MRNLRRHLRRWAFAVMFAVLGMALAPAASQAAMALSGNRWVEVCSAAGSRWVAVDAASGQASGPSMAGSAVSPVADMPPCPLCCQLHAGPGLPAPTASQRGAWTRGAEALPALASQAPRPMPSWAAPQPRGPPVPV